MLITSSIESCCQLYSIIPSQSSIDFKDLTLSVLLLSILREELSNSERYCLMSLVCPDDGNAQIWHWEFEIFGKMDSEIIAKSSSNRLSAPS